MLLLCFFSRQTFDFSFAVFGSMCIERSSPGVDDAYGSDIISVRVLNQICNRGSCLDVLLSNGAFPHCCQGLRSDKICGIYGSLLQSDVRDDF